MNEWVNEWMSIRKKGRKMDIIKTIKAQIADKFAWAKQNKRISLLQTIVIWLFLLRLKYFFFLHNSESIDPMQFKYCDFSGLFILVALSLKLPEYPVTVVLSKHLIAFLKAIIIGKITRTNLINKICNYFETTYFLDFKSSNYNIIYLFENPVTRGIIKR